MSFSYFDKDNNIKKLDIQVGMNWSDVKTDNEKLNSVFAEVDDGDGVVQFTEKMVLDNFLKQADNQDSATANNQILETEELANFDIVNAKLGQTFNKEDFSVENLKKHFPEDKYKIFSNNSSTTIVDKNDKVVLKLITKGSKTTITEYSADEGGYQVSMNGDTNYISRYFDADDRSTVESSTRFKGSQLDSFEDADLDSFLQKYSTPESIDMGAIQTLDSMSPKLLKEVIRYNYEEKKKFLLEQIETSPNIPEDVKKPFLERATKKLEEMFGYKEPLTIENSQVNTNFYKSEDVFDVKFEDNTITITKKPKAGLNDEPQTYTIDMNKLLEDVPVDLRPPIKAALERIPGEALMDLSIEADRFSKPGRSGDKVLGRFDQARDRISVGYNYYNVLPQTIVHELGHALDTGAVNGDDARLPSTLYGFPWGAENNDNISKNKNYARAYIHSEFKYLGLEEYMKNPDKKNWKLDIKKLIKDGYLDSTGTYWTEKFTKLREKTYMYSSSAEGASELYAHAMLGFSNGTPEEAIEDNLMQQYLQLMQKTRNMKPEDRHKREE